MRLFVRLFSLCLFCAGGAALALWFGQQAAPRSDRAASAGDENGASDAVAVVEGPSNAVAATGHQTPANEPQPSAKLEAENPASSRRADVAAAPTYFDGVPSTSPSPELPLSPAYHPRTAMEVHPWPPESRTDVSSYSSPRYDAKQGADDFGNLLAESFVRRVVEMVQEESPPVAVRSASVGVDDEPERREDEEQPQRPEQQPRPQPAEEPPSKATPLKQSAEPGEQQPAGQPDEQSSKASSIQIRPQQDANSDAQPQFPRLQGEDALSGEGDDRLQIYIKGGDIREVLAQLSAQGNLNILPTNSVQGTVSIALADVSADTALDAILRSTGYNARREGKFIFVGTEADFTKQERAADVVGIRVYRPNYVSAKDLKELITPLITASTGKISVTPPPQVGIQTNDNDAGGDSMASREAILVQDFESVLDHIDQIVRNVDRRPPQVSIEAMILSVQINDNCDLGVDFEMLRDQGHLTLAGGSPTNDLASLTFENGGLKLAYLDGSMSGFVTALETFGDTNVIATPKLMALNKQRAEILIGAQLGYVSTTVTETAATQSVEFLEVGTQLRLRPFISSDGMVRLEVHPELSTGNVRIEDGITLPDKEVTKVTTNVMVRDGCTVILGGLMREDLARTGKQIPWVGSMPIIGPLFRLTNEKTERREILVLLTPHIVHDPDVCCEGDLAAAEFHRRQSIAADKMSPLGKRYMGRKYFRLAQEAWAIGDRERAMRYINLSIHVDPFSRAAIELRSDIVNGVPHGAHTLDAPVGAPGEFELPPPEAVEPIEQDQPPEGAHNGAYKIESRPLPSRGEQSLPPPGNQTTSANSRSSLRLKR
jgi:type II secretory pathway component GspD/PulD (secretin)